MTSRISCSVGRERDAARDPARRKSGSRGTGWSISPEDEDCASRGVELGEVELRRFSGQGTPRSQAFGAAASTGRSEGFPPGLAGRPGNLGSSHRHSSSSCYGRRVKSAQCMVSQATWPPQFNCVAPAQPEMARFFVSLPYARVSLEVHCSRFGAMNS